MDFNNKIPLYIQICEYIKQEIVTGKLAPNCKMPSVRELSSELKVNPNTIQRVCRELEAENLIESRRGMGIYITGDINTITQLKDTMAESLVSDFINKMKAIGINSSEIINKTTRRIENAESK